MNEARSEEELLQVILHLQRRGLSLRAIGRELGICRNRVRRALAKHQERRDSGHDVLDQLRRRHRNSKLDVWVPFIQRLLEKYPTITATRMLEELRAEGYQGGQTMVRQRVRQLRPKPKKEPVLRFETEPGVQGQMDWSPYKLDFRRTGRQEVWCFSYILGYSRRQYIDFTSHRRFHTMIRRHRDAFTYFGGVPQHCLYDGEKTVILRWEAGRPVYNPKFLAFLTHYGCRPVGCLPGRAQTKGKVEQPFKNVEGNLLNGRSFEDLDDLRRVARWWLATWSDTHRHRTTGQPPLERFREAEQQALQPLPAHPYDTSEVTYLVGREDGFVVFKTNLYSIPYAYILTVLILKADDHEVWVYSPDIQEIARHPRCPDGARQTETLPAHHESARFRWGIEPIREQFLRLGCHAGDFLAGLTQATRQAGSQARHILKLLDQYEAAAINLAFKHALRYHAFQAAAVENILKARFQPRELAHWVQPEKATRPLPQIEQRPLEDYPFLDEEGEP